MQKLVQTTALALSLAAITYSTVPLAHAQDSNARIQAQQERSAQAILADAIQTLEAMKTKPRFAELLPEAKAVVIAPSLFKMGFIIGGRGGQAVMLVRNESDDGWSAPAFYGISAASVGLQFGVEVSEMALLVMTDEALNQMLAGSLELGAGIDVTVGSLGAEGGIDTATDVYTFTLTQGAFAGVSLEGASLNYDEARNRAFYNQDLTAEAIVLDDKIKTGRAKPLYAVLNS